jgi:sugar phosphate isomerase/epimerase
VPIGAPQGHPELFELASNDPRIRAAAVRHTVQTIEFAASVGAVTVVAHAGNVDMWNRTRKLVRLAENGMQFSRRYERIKLRLLARREKKAPRHLDALRRSLDELLPALDAAKVRVAFENLPSWEAIPTESEMEALLAQYDSPRFGYWHDIGHAQVRQNLGFTSQLHWLQKLRPRLFGLHIHDVAPPAWDHRMPPAGAVDFAALRPLVQDVPALVLEPVPGAPDEEVKEGCRHVEAAWRSPAPSAGPGASAS